MPTYADESLLPVNYTLRQITYAGNAWYWVVFGVMAASAIGIALLTFWRPFRTRAHGYCTCAILTIAATAYLAMAMQAGFGITPVYDEVSVARSTYWARYIDWFLTTPLLLLDILLLASVPIGTVLWIIFADILMILTGLFGALMTSRYKWGWFGIGCAALFIVTWGMIVVAPKHAAKRSKKVAATYTFLGLYLIALWWAYPVCWGLAEGSNTISVTAEAFFYGALDLATKVGFGWLIMLMAEPVLKLQRCEEESEWGTPLPSLLEAPVSAPLLEAWRSGHSLPTHRRVMPSPAKETVPPTTAAGAATTRTTGQLHDPAIEGGGAAQV